MGHCCAICVTTSSYCFGRTLSTLDFGLRAAASAASKYHPHRSLSLLYAPGSMRIMLCILKENIITYCRMAAGQLKHHCGQDRSPKYSSFGVSKIIIGRHHSHRLHETALRNAQDADAKNARWLHDGAGLRRKLRWCNRARSCKPPRFNSLKQYCSVRIPSGQDRTSEIKCRSYIMDTSSVPMTVASLCH